MVVLHGNVLHGGYGDTQINGLATLDAMFFLELYSSTFYTEEIHMYIFFYSSIIETNRKCPITVVRYMNIFTHFSLEYYPSNIVNNLQIT